MKGFSMKLVALVVVLGVLGGAGLMADDASDVEVFLRLAQKHYDEGRRDYAKRLYEQAAMRGSAKGHFALAYRSTLSRKDNIFHLTEAARQGHERALDGALDALLFRAASLEWADPKRALELYYTAKKVNPDIELFDEKETLRTLKKCAEPTGFDAAAFMKKYGIEENDENRSYYYVWELAEEASRGGRFGKPDPELVFNLVIRGGFVPAELKYAVARTYENWKAGRVEEFKIDDYVTSAVGSNFCIERTWKKEEVLWQQRLDAISKELDEKKRGLVSAAYEATCEYTFAKAAIEEDHGGGGGWMFFWIQASAFGQYDNFVDMVEQVAMGFYPERVSELKESEKEMTERFQQVLKMEVKDGNLNVISPDDIRSVQQRWTVCRDASAELFFALNPKCSLDEWKSWLTMLRLEWLNKVVERTESQNSEKETEASASAE